jgi:hypothetical protein
MVLSKLPDPVKLNNLQILQNNLMGQRFNGHDLHFYLREQGIDSKQFILSKESNDENTFVF